MSAVDDTQQSGEGTKNTKIDGTCSEVRRLNGRNCVVDTTIDSELLKRFSAGRYICAVRPITST